MDKTAEEILEEDTNKLSRGRKIALVAIFCAVVAADVLTTVFLGVPAVWGVAAQTLDIMTVLDSTRSTLAKTKLGRGIAKAIDFITSKPFKRCVAIALAIADIATTGGAVTTAITLTSLAVLTTKEAVSIYKTRARVNRASNLQKIKNLKELSKEITQHCFSSKEQELINSIFQNQKEALSNPIPKKPISFTRSLINAIGENIFEGAVAIAGMNFSALTAFVSFGAWKDSKLKTEHREFDNALIEKTNLLATEVEVPNNISLYKQKLLIRDEQIKLEILQKATEKHFASEQEFTEFLTVEKEKLIKERSISESNTFLSKTISAFKIYAQVWNPFSRFSAENEREAYHHHLEKYEKSFAKTKDKVKELILKKQQLQQKLRQETEATLHQHGLDTTVTPTITKARKRSLTI